MWFCGIYEKHDFMVLVDFALLTREHDVVVLGRKHNFIVLVRKCDFTSLLDEKLWFDDLMIWWFDDWLF